MRWSVCGCRRFMRFRDSICRSTVKKRILLRRRREAATKRQDLCTMETQSHGENQQIRRARVAPPGFHSVRGFDISNFYTLIREPKARKCHTGRLDRPNVILV